MVGHVSKPAILEGHRMSGINGPVSMQLLLGSVDARLLQRGSRECQRQHDGGGYRWLDIEGLALGTSKNLFGQPISVFILLLPSFTISVSPKQSSFQRSKFLLWALTQAHKPNPAHTSSTRRDNISCVLSPQACESFIPRRLVSTKAPVPRLIRPSITDGL
jgi:hypothetical protein